MRVISASPAPLPPRISFMPPVPSAFFAPKKYTYFIFLLNYIFLKVDDFLVGVPTNRATLPFDDYRSCEVSRRCLRVFRAQNGKIRDGRKFLQQHPEKRQAI